MSALLESMLDELREFAVELLDPGLAPSVRRMKSAVPGSLAMLLDGTEILTSLVPRLLADLEDGPDVAFEDERPASTPLRATWSHRASDWEAARGTLLPRRFTALVSVARPDVRPISWLLHVLEVQSAELLRQGERLRRRAAEAQEVRAGSSVFARSEAETLRSLVASVEDASAALCRAVRIVEEEGDFRLSPSPRLPRPFPRSASWASLRRIAEPILRPTSGLPAFVQGVLRDSSAGADAPFLYQRWCGVKLVETFRRLGFAVVDDPAGPLFLGGRIRFKRDGLEIVLWCEPRLLATDDHPSGFAAMRGEATPDYLLVVPGPAGEDGFVLDPTIDVDPEARNAKARYLRSLVARRRRFVAGIPTTRPVLRSWAAAPLGGNHCDLGSPDGARGTIPMLPGNFEPAPLEQWILDLVAYGVAWAGTKRG